MNTKNKIVLSLILLSIIFVFFILFTLKKNDLGSDNMNAGNSHLEYVYGTVDEIKLESFVITLDKPFGEDNVGLPSVGEKINIFMPIKETEETVINALKVGDSVKISIYGLYNIYNNNGIYSIIVIEKSQIMESD